MNPTGDQDEDLITLENRALQYCDDKIEYYGRRAKRYGLRLWYFCVFGLLFSVAVTVLSGIAFVQHNAAWMTTIAGGLSTFFASILAATKTQEYHRSEEHTSELQS